jgi:hypothetical protein
LDLPQAVVGAPLLAAAARHRRPFDPTHRESTEHVSAFSPRLASCFSRTGQSSLYASYSRSFNPLQLIHYINIVNIEPFRASSMKAESSSICLARDCRRPRRSFRSRPTDFRFATVSWDDSRTIGFQAVERIRGGINRASRVVVSDGLVHVQRRQQTDRLSWAVAHERRSQQRVGLGDVDPSAGTPSRPDSGRRPICGWGASRESVRDVGNSSYARVDGLVRYERAKWNVQLNLKNLTSRRYYDTDAVQGLLLPGSPFSPELTFRLKL